MNNKKAIIFDLEGVLIDTETLWDIETETLLARRGIAYHREAIKHLLSGHSLEEASQVLKTYYSIEMPLNELVAERFAIMVELINNRVAFFDGVESFITSIKSSYKIAVATAMDRVLLQFVDDKIGLSKLFDGNVFCVADVDGISKDKPDLFLHVINQLRVVSHEAIIVEDSPLPVVGAHAAGIEVIALATTYKANKLEAADYILESFTDLIKMF